MGGLLASWQLCGTESWLPDETRMRAHEFPPELYVIIELEKLLLMLLPPPTPLSLPLRPPPPPMAMLVALRAAMLVRMPLSLPLLPLSAL